MVGNKHRPTRPWYGRRQRRRAAARLAGQFAVVDRCRVYWKRGVLRIPPFDLRPPSGRRAGERTPRFFVLGLIMAADQPLGSVEVSLTPLERFEEFLQSRGKRITKQRRLLVKHVFQHHQHFDAEELIAEMSSKKLANQAVSRPTVYRALGELVEAGLLRQMTLRGRTVYEHDYGYPQHDHLYCQQCEQLIEFRSDELLDLRDRVAQEHRFQVAGHRLIIHGIC